MLALGLSATVHAATTCASLACMEDLNALSNADLNALSEEAVKNSCVQYSTDAEACVKAYMTRTDGTYSPCEYSLLRLHPSLVPDERFDCSLAWLKQRG